MKTFKKTPLFLFLTLTFYLLISSLSLHARFNNIYSNSNDCSTDDNNYSQSDTSNDSISRGKKSETLNIYETGNQNISLRYRTKTIDNISESISAINAGILNNIANTNIFNTLTGKLPGLVINQRGGIPGNEWARVLVRGQNSFNVNYIEPLILLDGIETDVSFINPNTIKSITVLKDAGSTSMFGLRGAAGVILIDSHHGEEGPLTVQFNSQGSVVQPLKVPSFLNAYEYALLRNEANINDGNDPGFSSEDIENFRTGDQPYKYPDVDWVDNFLLDHSYQTRNNLSISGADEQRKYYFSLGNLNNTGIFNIDPEANTYNTNTGFNSTDFQTRVSYKATNKLTASVDLKARLDVHRTPGKYNNFENRIFYNLYNTPASAIPVFNPDGSLGGDLDYRNNVYGELNHTGYSIMKRAFTSATIDLQYDLNEFWVIVGKFGYVNFADHITDRTKNYAVFQYENADNINQIGQNTNMANYSIWGPSYRNLNGEVGLMYKKDFHNNFLSTGIYADKLQKTRKDIKIPRIYQSIRGFASYILNEKYIIDLTFSYMGSEQFPPKQRYGFFPALSLAWKISSENFFSKTSSIDLLKLRASYGITGNDFDSFNNESPYFEYLENFSPGMGYNFGFNTTWEQGFFESNAANTSITWQTTSKFNAGIDASILDQKLSLSADYFNEESKDILVYAANTALIGNDFWIPAGIAGNQGFEASVNWQQINQRLNWFINANLLFVKNKVIEQSEPMQEYDWMMRTGHPIYSMFGYTFDRFFTEDDLLQDIPDHTLLGQIKPGDMIYKDLNEDGLIDNRDISFIANPDVPDFHFGLGTGIQFQNFDLTVHLQGITGAQTIFRNPFLYDFSGGTGNLLPIHLDRWIPGKGQQAEYPRLSISQSEINRVNSTFWVKELNYLRIKSAEAGYSFQANFLENYNIRKFRIYLSAYNLYTWDNTGVVDPDYRPYGNYYPITRYFSAGINLIF